MLQIVKKSNCVLFEDLNQINPTHHSCPLQVTLKSRDMKEKFVVSNVQLKNLENSLVREVAHMWFTGWPASGVPNEEAGFISFILEVRRTRKRLRAKGPIVVHCR